MVILSTDDWVCILVLFGFVRRPAQGATGVWEMPVLVFKWALTM